MHSVLVFGDVRTHQFRRDPSPDKRAADAPTTFGGAFFHADAVQLALEELSLSPDGSPPTTYSFKDEPGRQEPLGFDFSDWKLKQTELERPHEELGDGQQTQCRLELLQRKSLDKPNQPRPAKQFPQISDELRKALAKFNSAGDDDSGCFDPRGRDDRPWCPDIVVFDDLDADLRSVVIGEKNETRPDKVPAMSWTRNRKGSRSRA
jgi:hypothetical protein